MSKQHSLSITFRINVQHQQSVPHPLSCVGIGNTLVAFKTKREVLLSIECPSEVRGKILLKWTSINLSSKLSLTQVMLTIIKKFIILFLLCLQKQGTPWQFSKQISKLSFQLSVQICSLLDQTEGERNAFFGRTQEEGPHCEIIPKSTWLI